MDHDSYLNYFPTASPCAEEGGNGFDFDECSSIESYESGYALAANVSQILLEATHLAGQPRDSSLGDDVVLRGLQLPGMRNCQSYEEFISSPIPSGCKVRCLLLRSSKALFENQRVELFLELPRPSNHQNQTYRSSGRSHEGQAEQSTLRTSDAMQQDAASGNDESEVLNDFLRGESWCGESNSQSESGTHPYDSNLPIGILQLSPFEKNVTYAIHLGNSFDNKSTSYAKANSSSILPEAPYNHVLVLSARKTRSAAGIGYNIYANSLCSKKKLNVIAELSSNFIGTKFTLRLRTNLDGKSVLLEHCAVKYKANIIGLRGPREMTILLPKISSKGECTKIYLHSAADSLLYRTANKDDPDVLKLHNKAPQWNETAENYVLNFNGRVTQSSVKNFQLIHGIDLCYHVMQFGRTEDDRFIMDCQYPITLLQAFAISLTSLDSKIGCE